MNATFEVTSWAIRTYFAYVKAFVTAGVGTASATLVVCCFLFDCFYLLLLFFFSRSYSFLAHTNHTRKVRCTVDIIMTAIETVMKMAQYEVMQISALFRFWRKLYDFCMLFTLLRHHHENYDLQIMLFCSNGGSPYSPS